MQHIHTTTRGYLLLCGFAAALCLVGVLSARTAEAQVGCASYGSFISQWTDLSNPCGSIINYGYGTQWGYTSSEPDQYNGKRIGTNITGDPTWPNYWGDIGFGPLPYTADYGVFDNFGTYLTFDNSTPPAHTYQSSGQPIYWGAPSHIYGLTQANHAGVQYGWACSYTFGCPDHYPMTWYHWFDVPGSGVVQEQVVIGGSGPALSDNFGCEGGVINQTYPDGSVGYTCPDVVLRQYGTDKYHLGAGYSVIEPVAGHTPDCTDMASDPSCNSAWTITLTPSPQSVAQGGTAVYAVTVSSFDNMHGSVDLAENFACPVTSSGGNCTLGQSSVSVPSDGSATTTYSVVTTKTTPAGPYALEIAGTINGVSQNADAALNVTAPAVTASISADSTAVPYNSNTVIHWSIANATSAMIDSSPTDPQFNNRSVTDTAAAQDNTSNLTQTTTYTLTAQGTGGPLTKTVTVSVGPSPPGTPVAKNTAIDASVPCGNILINWSAAPGINTATSKYFIYRSTDTANPTQSGNPWVIVPATQTSYQYTPPSTDPAYYYWVATSDGTLVSSLSGPSALVRAVPCAANLSLSDKVLTAVNGQGYPYTSGCIGNAGGTPVQIKDGNTTTFSINLCNVGNFDADNVTVVDTLTALINPTNYRLNGNPMAGVAYDPATGTINFGNIGAIAQGSRVVITYDATAKRAPGSQQNLNRFRNQAAVTYTTAKAPDNGGCVGTGTDSTNPCRLDTGYIVFYTSNAPVQNEIQ